MQNRTSPKMFPMPQSLRTVVSSEDQDTRNVIRAMGDTIKGLLLDNDAKVRSMYLNIKGDNGIAHSLNIHGKMTGTGWKTTIILSGNADHMITFEVKLPRGRCSYKTDILARLVTEEVTQEYAEYALVQLLRTNDREDVLLDSLARI